MWQIFMLASLFSNALENVLDKSSLTGKEKVDQVVATFVRVGIFAVLLSIPGLLGFFGGFKLYLSWWIIGFGFVSALYSLSYTYILERVEVTAIASIMYVGPVVYLLVDVFFLHVPLSLMQLGGITLLVIGGVGFSLDGKTHKLRDGLSLFAYTIFAFWLTYSGVEAYFFKYMHTEYNVSSSNFFASVWISAALFLLFFVLAQRKFLQIFTRSIRHFATKSILSKSCDTSNTLFFGQALSLASVSQVSAMGALDPLILFLTTALFQGEFKMNIGERLDRPNVVWKCFMIIILISGGLLVK